MNRVDSLIKDDRNQSDEACLMRFVESFSKVYLTVESLEVLLCTEEDNLATLFECIVVTENSRQIVLLKKFKVFTWTQQ
jgi:hypothetical protein